MGKGLKNSRKRELAALAVKTIRENEPGITDKEIRRVCSNIYRTLTKTLVKEG